MSVLRAYVSYNCQDYQVARRAVSGRGRTARRIARPSTAEVSEPRKTPSRVCTTYSLSAPSTASPASRPTAMPSGTGARNVPIPTPPSDTPALGMHTGAELQTLRRVQIVLQATQRRVRFRTACAQRRQSRAGCLPRIRARRNRAARVSPAPGAPCHRAVRGNGSQAPSPATNNRSVAASVMATTHRWVARRSTEIAKNSSTISGVRPRIFMSYCVSISDSS